MASKKHPLAGKRCAFFGELAIWPSYHGTTPEGVARRHGATIVDSVEDADLVVLGDHRGTGRAEAKKKAERLKKAGKLELLDEAAFRELVRIDLKGQQFSFTGGFDCSPSGLDDGLLTRMVETVGGVVVATENLEAGLDYLVVGNRRGTAKVATQNKVDKLIAAGADITKLDETGFLELVRVDKPAAGGALDFAAFIGQLYGNVDEKKLGRALDMLRKDRFQLYAKVDSDRLVGVVRSQSTDGVYASWLTREGHYGCAQPSLDACMGLQGTVCKHLMVLVVGLARGAELDLGQTLAWLRLANTKRPRTDNDLSVETFVQYKGAEAGEVDWRPTVTIPEDFYAV